MSYPPENNIPTFCRHRVIFALHLSQTNAKMTRWRQKAGILFSGGYDISSGNGHTYIGNVFVFPICFDVGLRQSLNQLKKGPDKSRSDHIEEARS